ncbi:MAG TPA: glycosyltransferase family 2 protein [Acidimicrobiia bacterium]|nr:glycosyltransferase family 2 protein [Acidimicrobiia bacterium]
MNRPETDARWAAVVINYEAGALLVDCVRSLFDDTSAGSVELVVVDNGSNDGSIEKARAEFPMLHVITSPGNVGYARAANLGIAATRAPIVAVCNSDLVAVHGVADALVGRLERDARTGACGPRIRNPDGSDYPSARRLPSIPIAVGHGLLGLWWRRNPFTARYRELDADPARARTVDWVSGAAIWLRRDALDEIGGWDERYFMYVEDLDLCWRLRRKRWDIVYEPAGIVMHVQGVSTSRRPYRMLLEHHRSAWRFARRRFTGVRMVLLPFAALYLSVRAALAMIEHGWRARRGARSGG